MNLQEILENVNVGETTVFDVTMKPQVHPLWKPWADIAGTTVALEKFAQFVAQNRRAIVKPDGKEIALTLSQVRAVVNVTVERGRGKDAVNGLMVTTKIQGIEKKEAVELPDEITLAVPLYVGTAKKEIELDLCIEADREGHVGVIVTAGTVAEAKVAAFEEMIAVVREGVKGLKATITLGKPKTGAWVYLKELA